MGFGLSNRYGLWVMGEFGPFGREPTQLWEFMVIQMKTFHP